MARETGSRYLVRRAGTLHYRRVVPPPARALAGCRVWKRSLKTGDLREAEARARLLAVEHDELIAKAKGGSPKERYEALSRLGPVRLERADVEGNTRRVVDRLRATLTNRQEAFRSTMAEASAKVSSLAPAERERVESEGGLHNFGLNYLVGREKLTSLKAKKNNDQDTKFVVEGRQRDIEERARILSKLGVTVFDTKPDDPGNPRVSQALDPWFAERKQGISAQRRHRVAVRRFIELHGDIAVREITRQHVLDYRAKIEGLADHRRIPAKRRGTLADPGADIKRVAAPTVERHLISIKALLTFAIEKGWVETNVADGVRPPKDTRPVGERRRNFTFEEQRKLLAQSVAEGGENGEMAWLIRLAAYTASRLEECCQLDRANVRKIDGIICIEITDAGGKPVKNAGSVRTVPLHPAIAEDFFAWAHKGDGKRVFSTFPADRDGRFANKVSGAMARLMDRAGLSDPRLVHHSWRHTLKRAMTDTLIDGDVRRAIMGQAPRDVHDRYGGGVSLKTMADELARVPPLFGTVDFSRVTLKKE